MTTGAVAEPAGSDLQNAVLGGAPFAGLADPVTMTRWTTHANIAYVTTLLVCAGLVAGGIATFFSGIPIALDIGIFLVCVGVSIRAVFAGVLFPLSGVYRLQRFGLPMFNGLHTTFDGYRLYDAGPLAPSLYVTKAGRFIAYLPAHGGGCRYGQTPQELRNHCHDASQADRAAINTMFLRMARVHPSFARCHPNNWVN